MEQGIVIGGDVLSGTDWCLRDPKAWWSPDNRERQSGFGGFMGLDRYQLRRRADVTDLLVGHWTAGEAGIASIDDDGPWVTRVMKRRRSRKNPNRRLKVSIQFVIGACSPSDEYAPVWQTMDIGLEWAATHVGWGQVNARSIGVEVVNAGLDGQTNVRDRNGRIVHLGDGEMEVLEFYPGQLRSFVRLANTLSGECLPGGIKIPRQVPVETGNRIDDGPDAIRPLSRRFTKRELAGWKGGMEHYLMHNTRKVDAGTLLLQALLDDGWEGVKI